MSILITVLGVSRTFLGTIISFLINEWVNLPGKFRVKRTGNPLIQHLNAEEGFTGKSLGIFIGITFNSKVMVWGAWVAP